MQGVCLPFHIFVNFHVYFLFHSIFIIIIYILTNPVRRGENEKSIYHSLIHVSDFGFLPSITWYYALSPFICDLPHSFSFFFHLFIQPQLSKEIQRILKKRVHLSMCTRFSFFYLFNNASISFNFSSKTLHASSIGSGDVISTPAFFKTSIG